MNSRSVLLDSSDFSECVDVLPAIVGKGHTALRTEPGSMILMDPKEKQCSSSWLTDNTRAVPKSYMGEMDGAFINFQIWKKIFFFIVIPNMAMKTPEQTFLLAGTSVDTHCLLWNERDFYVFLGIQNKSWNANIQCLWIINTHLKNTIHMVYSYPKLVWLLSKHNKWFTCEKYQNIIIKFN